MNKNIKFYTQEDLKNRQEAYLKSPLNQEALNNVKTIFKQDLEALDKGFKYCIFKNKKTVFKALKQEFYNIFDSLKTQEDLINIFEFKYSNNKIDYSIIINYSPYLLCHSMSSGSCNLSNKCYSSKQELSRTNNNYYSLKKWLKNYIFFNYLRFIKNPQGLLYKAFLKIRESYNNKIKKPLIVRFNEKSDIKDNFILSCYSYLSDLFYNYFKINSYSYTKNKTLDYSQTSRHLTVKKSLGLYCQDTQDKIDLKNMFITVDSQEDLEELINKGIKECQGSCFKCGFNCSKLNTPSRVCKIH